MKNPKNDKEADELYRLLFIPRPCPCGEKLTSNCEKEKGKR